MPLTIDSFPAVLARVREGDERAFRELFDELQPAMLRYLAGVESRGADDVAAAAWVNIAKQVRHFEGSLPEFRAWVFVIVRRRLSDYRHAEGRAPNTLPDAAMIDELPGGSLSALDVERLSESEAAQLVVRNLSPEQAEVVLLRVVGGLDVDQVAELLGRTSNWVRVTQHRALRLLERRLTPRRDR